jgi:hypothetical protein
MFQRGKVRASATSSSPICSIEMSEQAHLHLKHTGKNLTDADAFFFSFLLHHKARSDHNLMLVHEGGGTFHLLNPMDERTPPCS